MDALEFVRKWRDVDLTEKSASQQHFLDLCELLDHPKPAEMDKTGESFTFEKGAAKRSGGEGWADAWKAESLMDLDQPSCWRRGGLRRSATPAQSPSDSRGTSLPEP